MNSTTENWVNFAVLTALTAGGTFFGALSAGSTARQAGIAAGVAGFGTALAHFKTAPSVGNGGTNAVPSVAPGPAGSTGPGIAGASIGK